MCVLKGSVRNKRIWKGPDSMRELVLVRMLGSCVD